MRKFLLVWLIFAASFAGAQTTAVSATEAAFANGTWAAAIIPPAGSISFSSSGPLLNGSAFTQTYSGTFDGSGALSVTVADNAQVSPAGTKWFFTVCPPAGQGPCASTAITITGASQNITTVLNAAIRALSPTGAAYGSLSGTNTWTGAQSFGRTVLFNCGTTDVTAALNAVLVNGGHVILGLLPGATQCLISSRLIVPSNTWLDAGSTPITNSTNVGLSVNGPPALLQNYADTTSNRTVSDAAITSGAATLTSNTANFTSADLGSSVYIGGADVSSQTLCVTITAVNSATSVTVSRNAGTTVSGASATVYRRDSNITITGGLWSYTTSGWGFKFQHLDGLTVRDVHIKVISSDTGSQPITFGDVTKTLLDDPQLIDSAAGIAVRGPSDGLTFRNVSGRVTDDLLAILAHETIGSAYDYARGPVSNVLVDGLRLDPFPPGESGGGGSTTTGTPIDLIGGNSACKLTNFIVRNVYVNGNAGGIYAVYIGSDAGIGGVTYATNFLIDGVFLDGTAETHGVYAWATNGSDVTIRNVRLVNSTAASPHAVTAPNGSTWTRMVVDNVDVVDSSNATSGQPVYLANGSTVSSLTVTHVRYDPVSMTAYPVDVEGTVGSFSWSDFYTSTSNPLVPYEIFGSGSIGAVMSPLAHANAVLNGSDLTQSSWTLVGATTTATVITVTASGANAVKAVSPVSPGGLYTFSFLAEAGTLATPQYAIYDQTHGAFIVNATSYAALINGSSWSLVSVPFQTPAGCTQVGLYVMSNGTTTGTVSVTNVQVQ